MLLQSALEDIQGPRTSFAKHQRQMEQFIRSLSPLPQPIYCLYAPLPPTHLPKSSISNIRQPEYSFDKAQINAMFLQSGLYLSGITIHNDRLTCGNLPIKLASKGGNTYWAMVVLAPSFKPPVYSLCSKCISYSSRL